MADSINTPQKDSAGEQILQVPSQVQKKIGDKYEENHPKVPAPKRYKKLASKK